MKPSTFVEKISERYASATVVELRDIADLVSGLSEQSCETLFREFQDSYRYSTTPKRAVFSELIKKHNLPFHQRVAESTGGYECCCYVCGARFGLDQPRFCPNCRNQDKTWFRIIAKGAHRGYKLRADEESERELVFAGRQGAAR